MALLVRSSLLNSARRGIHATSVRAADKMMADPLEHATGLEKRQLLAELAGDDDPFKMKVFKRVDGGKDKPNTVPSAFDRRMVGCICEEDATRINWMWLHKGELKRCECGYWFKLVHVDPL